ncbi:response regulator [Fulvimarina sp. 2208YS6-2-32]|uniref:Response regulator n=1 Tax=Fulvimarina uroteuthidis TaxID=3098149 RepID=A0ABU5I258_9HYPH|nr:response regulator [Fulvimarina sp. 2208YS6-2-32]MDY8109415.1 response regulator [Fulvimarina sp. 2208YS6-2-32]
MSNKCVLIVEDESMLLLFASMALEDEGYHVHVAANGREGLRIAREQKPDVIITDYMMPEMNGIVMIQTLRDEGVMVPCVVTTAIPRDQLPDNAESVINFYIGKPYNEPELASIVRTALAG